VFELRESGFVCRSNGGRILLRWPDAAFLITSDQVLVESTDPHSSVEFYLIVMWSFVLALHGRGALHGSAVAHDGQAVAVLGNSGFGKSTIAAKAVADGWELVADDLVSPSESGELSVGPPVLRLPLAHPPRDDDTSTKPRNDDLKSRVRAPMARSPRLAAVVVMQDRFDVLARISGLSAFDAVLTHRYIPFAAVAGQRRQDLDQAARIVRTVPVFGAPARSLTVAQLAGVREAVSAFL